MSTITDWRLETGGCRKRDRGRDPSAHGLQPSVCEESPFTTKLHAHPSRLAQWLETGDCTPVTWELDLTNRCQHRCPLCFGGAGIAREQMTSEQAFDAIDQIAALGGKGLTLTGGGEPTLHPALDDCLTYAQRAGLDVALITNGGLRRDWIVAAQTCQWLRFSLDAYDAESFARTHGVGEKAWRTVLEQIAACMRIAPRKATVGVGYLVDARTVAGMLPATQLAKELGVDYIQFRPFLPTQPGMTIDYGGEQYFQQLEVCRQLESEQFRVFHSSDKFRNLLNGATARTYSTCWGASWASTIAADGKVYFCCHTRGLPDWCLGDLRTQSLADIWASDRRRQVKTNALTQCPPLCRCDAMNRCLDRWRQPVSHPSFL